MTHDLGNDYEAGPGARAERSLIRIGFFQPKEELADPFRSVTVKGEIAATMTLEFRWPVGQQPDALDRDLFMAFLTQLREQRALSGQTPETVTVAVDVLLDSLGLDTRIAIARSSHRTLTTENWVQSGRRVKHVSTPRVCLS